MPSIAEGRRGKGGVRRARSLDWRKKGFEIRAEADAVSAMIFIRAENAVQLTPLPPPKELHVLPFLPYSFHPTENMRHTLHNVRGRIIIYAHCVCLRRMDGHGVCKDSRPGRAREGTRKGVHYYNSLSPETWLAKPCSNYKESERAGAPALLRLL